MKIFIVINDEYLQSLLDASSRMHFHIVSFDGWSFCLL